MDNIKRKVFEVCFNCCTPYESLVDGYYAVDGVIYNSENEKVEEEEILMRDLFIK